MVDVSFERVSKRYGDVMALDELDLRVADGELLVLVGPSGSGKSTALRVLAGLERPEQGTVTLDGRDVADLPPHQRGVAMVFQDYALYPHLTVAENLGFGLRARRMDRAQVAATVTRVAAQLGLDELVERYPDQLSGGEQQRVALGRAMARGPGVYLLDEPLSNLDAQLRVNMRAEIVELQQRIGATMLYVTHDQAEAMTIAQRLAVLAGGRLQQVGTPQEVYDTPANTFVARFLGSPPMNLCPGGGVLGGKPEEIVGIRPEDLWLDPEGPVEGHVTVVEALGSETVLQVACPDGTRLAARTGPRSGHRVGDGVRLRVDTSRRHRFDPDSGVRLAAVAGSQQVGR